MDLNAGLVQVLRAAGRITDERVAQAFLATPRHLFLPGVATADAYRNDFVFTNWDKAGSPTSSVSAPWLVAMMIEHVEAKRGARLLEIGSGGYNAAIMRQIVGPDGSVTSLDIDPEVIARAADCLKAAGVQDVHLITADGELGAPDGAPYDGIMVTVQATGIAPAWLEQLAPDGRLVVPLRLRGLARLLTFTRDGSHWSGGGWEQCGFVPMQGIGAAAPVVTVTLAEGVRLRVDGPLPGDPQALAAAVMRPSREWWTGVTVAANEGTRPEVDLWLATFLDSFGRARADQDARGRSGPVTLPGGSTATWSAGSLAYLTMRPADQDGARFEYGVALHGSDQELAQEFAEHLRAWDREARGGPGPSLRLYPDDADVPVPPRGRRLDRPGPALVITWP